MLVRVHSAVLDGLDPRPVWAEVDVRPGLPSFTITGLGDLACRESRARVRSAILNQGYTFPSQRVTVKLAPVSLHKDRAGLDLAIAIGLLAATGQAPTGPLESTVIAGDLGLNGMLRPVRGTLQVAEQTARDRRTTLLVPAPNLLEAAIVPDLRLLAPGSLHDAIIRLSTRTWDDRPTVVASPPQVPPPSLDDFRGHKRVMPQLMRAVAARRSVLLVGPVGSGATMLARRATALMPAMVDRERLEVTRIHSACGLHHGHCPADERPFRAPHHSTTTEGLVGIWGRPGEVTLAHHGILFLDQITAFDPDALTTLRTTTHERTVRVQRHGRVQTMPAQALIIGTTRGCPCGQALAARCRCRPQERRHFDHALDIVRGHFDQEILVLPPHC